MTRSLSFVSLIAVVVLTSSTFKHTSTEGYPIVAEKFGTEELRQLSTENLSHIDILILYDIKFPAINDLVTRFVLGAFDLDVKISTFDIVQQ